MTVFPITFVVSACLLATFIFFFAREHSRQRKRGVDQESLLPLEEETPRVVGGKAADSGKRGERTCGDGDTCCDATHDATAGNSDLRSNVTRGDTVGSSALFGNATGNGVTRGDGAGNGVTCGDGAGNGVSPGNAAAGEDSLHSGGACDGDMHGQAYDGAPDGACDGGKTQAVERTHNKGRPHDDHPGTGHAGGGNPQG